MGMAHVQGANRSGKINVMIAIHILNQCSLCFFYEGLAVVTDSFWNKFISSLQDFSRFRSGYFGLELDKFPFQFLTPPL
jgi:hypothetical protein